MSLPGLISKPVGANKRLRVGTLSVYFVSLTWWLNMTKMGKHTKKGRENTWLFVPCSIPQVIQPRNKSVDLWR
jgi:hypothetical protein